MEYFFTEFVYAVCLRSQDSDQGICLCTAKPAAELIYVLLFTRQFMKYYIVQNGQALYDKIIAVSEADEKQEIATDLKDEDEKAKKSKNKHSYSGEHSHCY